MMAVYPNDPWARPGSPETAFDAAKKVAPAARSIRVRVLDVISSSSARGATGFEVADKLGLHVTQVRSRISELFAAKKVARSGRVRMGSAGCNGVVWVLPEYGPPPVDDGQGDLPGLAA